MRLSSVLTVTDLNRLYLRYLDCLNRQDWDRLGDFVSKTVRHNDRPFGLGGYRQMLEADFRAIPDLQFQAELIAVTGPILSARLVFDCTPVGTLFGLPVNSRRVRFAEHVFYHFEDGLITDVWSLVDTSAIAAQLPQS